MLVSYVSLILTTIVFGFFVFCFLSLGGSQVLSSYERAYTTAEQNMHATISPFIDVVKGIRCVTFATTTRITACICFVSEIFRALYTNPWTFRLV